MSLASVLLLTSEKEGMPNVVMEAQLLGLPVVAPCVGGVPDLVEDGRGGALVNSDDPDAFVQPCLSILTDMDLARHMGEEGRRRMLGSFSVSEMAKRYMQVVSRETVVPEARASAARAD
jgi:glycosyltransferase involved in cell wall biosynthesis